MKMKRIRHTMLALAIALVMMVTPAMTCMSDHTSMYNSIENRAKVTVTQLFAPDIAYASVSSSKAKSIATKDAKSRYKIKKALSVSVKGATYRNNAIWKVTFYGKKSSDKYQYIYYVSKSSGKIMYRKQY